MNLPVIAMLAAIFCFGLSTVGSKFLLAHLGFAQVSLVRFTIAAIFLWAVVLATGGIRKLRAISWKPMVLGLIEPGSVSLIFVAGLTQTNASHGAVLWGLTPIIAPWAGLLVLREKINRVNLLSSGLAVSGAAALLLLDDGRGGGRIAGDLICAAAVTLSTAAALLARRIATDRGAALLTTATQLSVAALLCLVVDLVTAPPTRIAELPAELWTFILPWAVMSGAAPFFLYNYGLRHLPVARAGLFPPLVAPVGATMAAVWLGEPIHSGVIVAITLILAAVFLPSLLRKAPS